jgi:glycogen phosphorylase
MTANVSTLPAGPETLGPRGFKGSILRHLSYSLGKDPGHASRYDWRVALSLALRDLVVDVWFASTRRTYEEKRKRVYYLSMEFLIGRLTEDTAVNLGIEQGARRALEELGQDYDAVVGDEPDAALGNGGLGRLAACYLDSLATLGISAHGYGIRYEHGLFHQRFENGVQIETAEDWLAQRHAWEFERPEVAYRIQFGGEVITHSGRAIWHPGDTVIASAFDTPVVGWRARWANTLRLWSAKPTELFDLAHFNRGDYLAASQHEALARTLSRVLYPDDTTENGRELRLKQEYFFTSASIQDILRRYRSEYDELDRLPERVAVQLNDTHPALAGPELVRLLVDEHGMDFDSAMEATQGCLSYTNHTLLPEALERWGEPMFARLLPRHRQIVDQIDEWHARKTAAKGGGDVRIVASGSVNMGELAFVSAHRVNGVSELHTELMRKTVFSRLDELYPNRIVNQTNGVTPRRWLYTCNAPLRSLISETIGEAWTDDLEALSGLATYVDDPSFLERFAAAKRHNKDRLAQWLRRRNIIRIDPSAMLDVHIKRIHEYKRQLLNLLEAVALWNAMHDEPNREWVPRVKVFAGKAAPGYAVAKQIIHLINDVARTINADPVTRELLRIVFIENYNVSLAEIVIPAADLSEQISTAGKEASGTGNMKLALNGAPTIGTLDGANIEIRECVGDENFFLFGLTAEEVEERRSVPGYARSAIEASPALVRVLDQIANGVFSPDDRSRYGSLIGDLYDHDHFLVTCDFDSYFARQRQVDNTFRDRHSWNRMAALNTAHMGWFTSDRAVRGYARDIWGVEPQF